MLAETADSLAAAVGQSILLQSKMCWVPGQSCRKAMHGPGEHFGPWDRESTGSDPPLHSNHSFLLMSPLSPGSGVMLPINSSLRGWEWPGCSSVRCKLSSATA